MKQYDVIYLFRCNPIESADYTSFSKFLLFSDKAIPVYTRMQIMHEVFGLPFVVKATGYADMYEHNPYQDNLTSRMIGINEFLPDYKGELNFNPKNFSGVVAGSYDQDNNVFKKEKQLENPNKFIEAQVQLYKEAVDKEREARHNKERMDLIKGLTKPELIEMLKEALEDEK